MKKLVLASSSPYRKILLSKLGYDFEIQKPLFNEDDHKNSTQHLQLVSFLAQGKAESISCKNRIVIGSDQMAIVNGRRLDKPGHRELAFKQLETLSGNTHELLTSVHLLERNSEGLIVRHKAWVNTTEISFFKLSKNEIDSYLDLDQPFDCAGSYKFELNGVRLISNLKTKDPTAIQGLPLIELNEILKNWEFQP